MPDGLNSLIRNYTSVNEESNSAYLFNMHVEGHILVKNNSSDFSQCYRKTVMPHRVGFWLDAMFLRCKGKIE